MSEKILIIGNLGSGAYLAFKHMILKEDIKSVLVDDISNEELIKKLGKSNVDKIFYKDEFEEKGIIKNEVYKKFFFNCPGMNIIYSDILSIENLVLRISVDDLFKISKSKEITDIFNKFDKVLIFASRKTYIDECKSTLKLILPDNAKKYINDFCGKDLSKHILISNENISFEKYYVEKELMEKLYINY